jgi:predicted N-acetyltransferase YhbS
VIRLEQTGDEAAIRDLTRRAFAPMPYAGGDEQDVIDRLRAGGALALSMVAVEDGRVIGHAALSPASHDSGASGWFALGPISVEPSLQGTGHGRALIQAAKTWLRGQGAQGCILTGNPRYYGRFGWVLAPQHTPDGEPAAYFQVLSLAADPPPGRFRFHPAFYG